MLLDIFRENAIKLVELEAQAKETGLDVEDMTELRRLKRMFTEEPDLTFLGRLDQSTMPDYTGDEVIDEFLNQLEGGEVPEEFWSDDGPRDKALRDPSGEALDEEDVADWFKEMS